MENNKKRASYQAVTVAEYRLLNVLAKNKEFRKDTRISEDIFTDELAKSLYVAIQNLEDNNIEITPASLLQAGEEIDFNINQQVVSTIWNIETTSISNIDDILNTLRTATLKNKLLSEIEDVQLSLAKPGEIETDELLSKLYSIDEKLQSQNKDTSKLLNFSTWSERYLEDLEARREGRKYSFGDPLLDKEFFRGALPGTITIIAAGTSMGKSTYVLSLMDSLLDQNTPCMYLSLEMGTIDTMDRLIAKRCDIATQSLYNPDEIDDVIREVNKERRILSNNKNFYFCEATSVDMRKLRTLIREFKQKSHSDYGLVAIDLLSGMKNFMVGGNGASTASMIENSMNQLENLAKEENVHIIGVVQVRRNNESSKIHCVDDIDNMRPTLDDIKNSGAYAEKSSELLTLFRKRFFTEKYLVGDEQAENLEDILEVQILKNRSGEPGKILRYMFDGSRFRVYPLADEEEEKLEKLENLSIDF